MPKALPLTFRRDVIVVIQKIDLIAAIFAIGHFAI